MLTVLELFTIDWGERLQSDSRVATLLPPEAFPSSRLRNHIIPALVIRGSRSPGLGRPNRKGSGEGKREEGRGTKEVLWSEATRKNSQLVPASFEDGG